MTTLDRLDATHNPHIRSWLESANQAGCAFPLQNLPFGVFRRDRSEPFRGGVAIGDQIMDLAALAKAQIFGGDAAAGVRAGSAATLNALMQLGPRTSNALRHALFEALSQGSALEAPIRK